MLTDIIHNLEKINHHGKRADAIVKRMLQHSHSSSAGIKEETDLNSLVDEFLELAYHGSRAKDSQDSEKKSFHADLHKPAVPYCLLPNLNHIGT